MRGMGPRRTGWSGVLLACALAAGALGAEEPPVVRRVCGGGAGPAEARTYKEIQSLPPKVRACRWYHIWRDEDGKYDAWIRGQYGETLRVMGQRTADEWSNRRKSVVASQLLKYAYALAAAGEVDAARDAFREVVTSNSDNPESSSTVKSAEFALDDIKTGRRPQAPPE